MLCLENLCPEQSRLASLVQIDNGCKKLRLDIVRSFPISRQAEKDAVLLKRRVSGAYTEDTPAQGSLCQSKSFLPCCNSFTGKLPRLGGKPVVRLKPKIDNPNCKLQIKIPG